jgi:hypothetical protein
MMQDLTLPRIKTLIGFMLSPSCTVVFLIMPVYTIF